MKKIENSLSYKKKLKILIASKKIIVEHGWSENIFQKLTLQKISKSDLLLLFPNGYIDLLDFALKEINIILTKNINKINIINFSTSKRIKKILITRLEILNKEKAFYKKTFNHLLLPQNVKILKKNLYKSIDEMWYLAGDNSTDFNFYTKRITLAAIYSSALFVFYNKNIKDAEINIEKNLKRISKIPKIKERFSFIKDNIPFVFRGFFN